MTGCTVSSHAINYSTNQIINELQQNNHVIGIFIDLSKAFDTINHNKLLVKLEHYGIRGSCHKLLTNYLSPRVVACHSAVVPASAVVHVSPDC